MLKSNAKKTRLLNPAAVIQNLARFAQQKLRHVLETKGTARKVIYFKVIYLNFNENISFGFKDANRIVFLLRQLLEKSKNLKDWFKKSPVKGQLKIFSSEKVLKEKLQVNDEEG
ncbi:hypothetical protein DdX_14313 [Ditylenchus destructor]|uniref:Uncharacterized protein n=1 Tax=Ditylenchus destructor TaxID=166010 RepID=A0AAD4R206_9BILA|nr:hypothetical protein DdX_14313 [Ditylenchus destructor]